MLISQVLELCKEVAGHHSVLFKYKAPLSIYLHLRRLSLEHVGLQGHDRHTLQRNSAANGSKLMNFNGYVGTRLARTSAYNEFICSMHVARACRCSHCSVIAVKVGDAQRHVQLTALHLCGLIMRSCRNQFEHSIGV